MSAESIAAFVTATGVWIILAIAVVIGPTKTPAEIWVSTASENVRSHPTLVRAALPVVVAVAD
jgi:hypothetical protein